MTLSFFKVPFISLVGRQDPLLNSKSSKIEFIYQIVTSKIEFIYQISQRNNLYLLIKMFQIGPISSKNVNHKFF